MSQKDAVFTKGLICADYKTEDCNLCIIMSYQFKLIC